MKLESAHSFHVCWNAFSAPGSEETTATQADAAPALTRLGREYKTTIRGRSEFSGRTCLAGQAPRRRLLSGGRLWLGEGEPLGTRHPCEKNGLDTVLPRHLEPSCGRWGMSAEPSRGSLTGKRLSPGPGFLLDPMQESRQGAFWKGPTCPNSNSGIFHYWHQSGCWRLWHGAEESWGYQHGGCYCWSGTQHGFFRWYQGLTQSSGRANSGDMSLSKSEDLRSWSCVKRYQWIKRHVAWGPAASSGVDVSSPL